MLFVKKKIYFYLFSSIWCLWKSQFRYIYIFSFNNIRLQTTITSQLGLDSGLIESWRVSTEFLLCPLLSFGGGLTESQWVLTRFGEVLARLRLSLDQIWWIPSDSGIINVVRCYWAMGFVSIGIYNFVLKVCSCIFDDFFFTCSH